MAKPELPPRLGVPVLMGLACLFAGNHIGARLAFDYGASVAAAVVMRSGVTALALFAWLKLCDVPLTMSRRALRRGLLVGLLMAIQSYCLYSAVAALPVALALLAFNTYPLFYVLLTWALGGMRPALRALVALPLALFGVLLALDAVGSWEAVAGRWEEIGVGVSWAFGGSIAFTLVLLLTMRHLRAVDGRVRTMLAMAVTAVAVAIYGGAADALAWPFDGAGWVGLLTATVLYGGAISAVFIIVPRLADPSNTAALNFEPVAAIGLGWAILGQAIAPLQLVGAAIIVGALLLIGSSRS